MALTQEQAAKLLGVTRPRISQLQTSGELPSAITPADVEEYRRKRDQRERERREFKDRWRESRKKEHEELVRLLASIDDRLKVLLAALVAREVLAVGANVLPKQDARPAR